MTKPLLLSIALLAGCDFRTSRHTTVVLSRGESDAILGDARGALATSAGPADVPCSVPDLERATDMTSFAYGSGIVEDAADYNAVLALDGDVKVVSQIDWCHEIRPGSLGCSPRPGSSIIVVRLPAAEGVLWAHELGHNKGLGHREDDGAVMSSIVAVDHTEVDAPECGAFRD